MSSTMCFRRCGATHATQAHTPLVKQSTAGTTHAFGRGVHLVVRGPQENLRLHLATGVAVVHDLIARALEADLVQVVRNILHSQRRERRRICLKCKVGCQLQQHRSDTTKHSDALLNCHQRRNSSQQTLALALPSKHSTKWPMVIRDGMACGFTMISGEMPLRVKGRSSWRYVMPTVPF